MDFSAAGMSSGELCVRLLDEARVLVYPGSSFGAAGDGYVRVSLLAPTQRLVEGVDRIEGFLARVGNPAR